MLKTSRIRLSRRQWGDIITATGIVVGFFALAALIYYNIYPIKLVDIKVPVATDRAFYKPGERVNGVFFGEIFYTGRVEVYTDIFCAGYRAPMRGDDGSVVFSGNSRPVVLQGDTRYIGRVPDDAPVGKNCVIQFVNNYDIKTPFGTRHEERAYYTQNFFIQSPDDDESENDNSDDLPPQLNSPNNTLPTAKPEADRDRLYDAPPDGDAPVPPQTTIRNDTTNNFTPPPMTEGPISPSEPIMRNEVCTINVFSLIRALCRTEYQ